MGVGTIFGSQRMTTTVGASTLQLACRPLWLHSIPRVHAMGHRQAAHDYKTMHASGLAPFEHKLIGTLEPGLHYHRCFGVMDLTAATSCNRMPTAVGVWHAQGPSCCLLFLGGRAVCRRHGGCHDLPSCVDLAMIVSSQAAGPLHPSDLFDFRRPADALHPIEGLCGPRGHLPRAHHRQRCQHIPVTCVR